MQSLYPFPGGKSDAKYDRYLYPQLNATAMCEPFMGAACRSLINNHLPTYLGEINSAQRAIALALHNPQDYIRGYQETLEWFWLDHEDDQKTVLSFAGTGKAQTALAKAIPTIYQGLTDHWKQVTGNLYEWMHDRSSLLMAGTYAFCIRACFGNVMRLNPKQTHFNVTWHVDKLKNACEYSPERWIEALLAKRWNPTVLNCWEDAIAAVPNPETTWLILDPPYCCDNESKMTPCYTAHDVTTKQGMATTFDLAVDSLKAGLERGFTHIDCCNYYSDRLDAAMRQITADAGYSLTAHLMGECKALGNSNGRRVHGQRIDKHARPVEVIYRISRSQQKQWAGVTVPVVKSEQMSLLEAIGTIALCNLGVRQVELVGSDWQGLRVMRDGGRWIEEVI